LKSQLHNNANKKQKKRPRDIVSGHKRNWGRGKK